MSYEKTNWKTGDVITAEKLNKLEDGVASGGSGGGSSEIVFKSDIPVSDGSVVTCNYTVAQVGDMEIDALPIFKLVLGTAEVYYSCSVEFDVSIGGLACLVIFPGDDSGRYAVTGSTSSGEWTIRKLNA